MPSGGWRKKECTEIPHFVSRRPSGPQALRCPMVQAYHVIFSTYGFWLPNDPRGSNSTFVRSWRLLPFGKATTTASRRSVASAAHDVQRRLAAKRELMFPPVRLSGLQARAVGRGFAVVIEKAGFFVHACAILPCHVHLVLARHEYRVEQMINLLKGGATRRLIEEGLHPLQEYPQKDGSFPSPWGAIAGGCF